jgi:hypothetical protein
VADAHAGHVELVAPGPPQVVFRLVFPPARRRAREQLREAVGQSPRRGAAANETVGQSPRQAAAQPSAFQSGAAANETVGQAARGDNKRTAGALPGIETPANPRVSRG